jgi:hypothetical protein
MIDSDHNPYTARTSLGLDISYDRGNPDWCFDRFGMSQTTLPDGSVVSIAGEHEDFYDPDFCIYNDVIVHRLDGRVEIFGYPRDVFPPTDFHTATLVGDKIVLIGSLGYQGERAFGRTPVCQLDVNTLRIEAVPAKGDCPGWIFKHSARLLADGGQIEVTGGQIMREGEDSGIKNASTFVLNLGTRTWSRSRDGSTFPQFALTRPGGHDLDVGRLRISALRPAGLMPLPVRRDQFGDVLERAFGYDGVRVLIRDEMERIGVLVEGQLAAERLETLQMTIKAALEQMLEHPLEVIRTV